MTAAPLPRLRPAGPWNVEEVASSRSRATLRLRHGDGPDTVVEVERCAAGRLRGTYPAGRHDIEIAITRPGGPEAEVLRRMVAAIWSVDSRCRRIVLALSPGDRRGAEAALAAGFRYGVDVDVPGAGTVDLFVIEPDWAVGVGVDVERVPTD